MGLGSAAGRLHCAWVPTPHPQGARTGLTSKLIGQSGLHPHLSGYRQGWGTIISKMWKSSSAPMLWPVQMTNPTPICSRLFPPTLDLGVVFLPFARGTHEWAREAVLRAGTSFQGCRAPGSRAAMDPSG